jgi:hypothetical protein
VTELERKHLVETDRHIAECKNYIAKQRELIERRFNEVVPRNGEDNARGVRGKSSHVGEAASIAP